VISIIRKVLDKAGIDRAVAYTIFSRIIQAGGGLIAVIFISKFLTANEQGYYYTFASIIAIQVFFELGLTGIITQYTAHEFAHLKWGNDYQLYGEAHYKSRLSSLLRFCIKWFGVLSIALFFLLLISGLFFFSNYNKGQNVNWYYPWVILCLSTSANLFIDPILAFFDGLGEVEDMAKVRLIQKVTFILLLYILFVSGCKLYSSAIASLVSISVNYLQIFLFKRVKLLKVIWAAKGEWVVDYFREIFPYQWKIALSWISGYFIFQLFNPILFATAGAVIAGQMGMTLTGLNGVISLSGSWINTKIPLFSGLIAKGEHDVLDKTFNSTVKKANLICAFFLIVFISGVAILKCNNIAIGNRFLPILPLSLLAISTFFSQYVSSLATYLRCHKQEPLLVQSIVMGILIAISTIVFGRLFGVNGIVIGYTTLGLVVGFPWALMIFINKRKEWHVR
jgi:O-antigen/teichoic acid export membrane protein